MVYESHPEDLGMRSFMTGLLEIQYTKHTQVIYIDNNETPHTSFDVFCYVDLV